MLCARFRRFRSGRRVAVKRGSLHGKGRTMQRRTVRIAVPVCAAALGMAPAVARADVVPAPPASATAVAAQVGSLLDVSKTDATAGSDGPTAGASVIRLQGQPVLNLGGTQQGDGESGGSLLDTGASLPARAQVAP